jgi:hypothetical protein
VAVHACPSRRPARAKGGDGRDLAIAKDAQEQIGKPAGRPGRPAGIAHRADSVVGRELELPDALAVLKAPAEAQTVGAQDPIRRIHERPSERPLVHRLAERLERFEPIWSVKKYVPFDSFVHSMWMLARGECGVFFTS